MKKIISRSSEFRQMQEQHPDWVYVKIPEPRYPLDVLKYLIELTEDEWAVYVKEFLIENENDAVQFKLRYG